MQTHPPGSHTPPVVPITCHSDHDDAQVHAQKELEGCTGKTDSEAEDDARAAGDDNAEDA